jgi:hypothetical protein
MDLQSHALDHADEGIVSSLIDLSTMSHLSAMDERK